jgi:hypothetical protein
MFMKTILFAIIFLSSMAIVITLTLADEKDNLNNDKENPLEIMEFKDSFGSTNAVYFLDLKGWMPFPGTSTNSGYLLYHGSWDYDVAFGSLHGQSIMDKHFLDFDRDGTDEIIVKFSDEEGFSGEAIRLTLDRFHNVHFQRLHFPRVEWPLDAENLGFDPLSIDGDSAVSWKAGPRSSDSLYQVKYLFDEDSLVMVQVLQ